jgi:hypothetical protein
MQCPKVHHLIRLSDLAYPILLPHCHLPIEFRVILFIVLVFKWVLNILNLLFFSSLCYYTRCISDSLNFEYLSHYFFIVFNYVLLWFIYFVAVSRCLLEQLKWLQILLIVLLLQYCEVPVKLLMTTLSQRNNCVLRLLRSNWCYAFR